MIAALPARQGRVVRAEVCSHEFSHPQLERRRGLDPGDVLIDRPGLRQRRPAQVGPKTRKFTADGWAGVAGGRGAEWATRPGAYSTSGRIPLAHARRTGPGLDPQGDR